jgi:hypothetical protein
MALFSTALNPSPLFVRERPSGLDGVQLASKNDHFLGYFQRLSRIKAIESSGFMERAMGIEPTSETWEVRGFVFDSQRFQNQPVTRLGHERFSPDREPKPVAQVAHLRRYSKDVSGCSTTPYDIACLVRNEEAETRVSPAEGYPEVCCARSWIQGFCCAQFCAHSQSKKTTK